MNINQVILCGRLTKDPELSKTNTGKSVCTFTVAIRRRGKTDASDFVQCVAWERSAEYLCTYGHKGQICAVTGSINTRTYDDRDGNKRYLTEVLANNLDLVNDGQKRSETADTTPRGFDAGVSVNIDPDDLPF